MLDAAHCEPGSDRGVVVDPAGQHANAIPGECHRDPGIVEPGRSDKGVRCLAIGRLEAEAVTKPGLTD